jgi:hypothetical protein
MKSNLNLIFVLVAVLPALPTHSLQADDWKTRDGKVYQDVKVISVAPDAVTILHQDGGALVPLANLPADLQKRFAYDPAKAQAAAARRAKTEAAERAAMLDRTAASLPTGTDGENQAPASASTSTAGSTSAPGAIDPLASPNASDPNHHTIGDVADATQTMHRDFADPTYHTMAHQIYVINTQGLGPDKSDPNHHTMDEIGN